MNNRFLKILISLVLTACMIATPVFGLQEGDADTQNQDQLNEEQLAEEQVTEGSEELPEATMGSRMEAAPVETVETEAVEEDAQEPEMFISEPEETPQDVEVKADSWRYDEGDVLEKYETLAATQVELPEEPAVTEEQKEEETNDKYWKVGNKTFSGGYLKGIDISVWQGQSTGLRSKVNWAAVNNDVKVKGVYDFVIIRCGYGKNTTANDDSEFAYNVSQCEKYKIPYGVYLYSYARNNTEAKSEAAHALRLLKGHYPNFPVYYDLEDSSITKATGKSKAKITAFAKIFCSTLDNNGYRAGVYANLNWFTYYLDKTALQRYNLWVAQWPNESKEYSSNTPYSIWQCSSSGSVSGICGRVDINLLVKPYADMEKFMTYSSLPTTLGIQNVNYVRYLNTNGVALRKGPGLGYRTTGIKANKRSRVTVTKTANGYSEITDAAGNAGWVANGYLVAPGTPWGFEKITEGGGEQAVTKVVLKSYANGILKNTVVNFGGYYYGTDGAGVKIVGRTAWSGYKAFIFDKAGHGYINKSKTKRKVTVYANPGSGKKGTLKRNKAFYTLRTSGGWSQMANGLWVKTSYTKKTAVYPTIRPNVATKYTTKMKKKTASYTGPSTAYIKKKTLKKNQKVKVVGTYGNWAKLSTGYWVPKGYLR